jgi:heterodisulfide reductase subunit B
MAVAEKLGIEFEEIDNWNCCGATEFPAVDLITSYVLITRNLALAHDQMKNGGQTKLVAPCSACALNLRKADHYLDESPELAGKINLALSEGGLEYVPGTVNTRHLLEMLVQDVGFEQIAEPVMKPLFGLKVAPYYGCVLVRPVLGVQWDDTHYPTSLDTLLEGIGADVVDYPMKTHCCGGHMTQISEETALEMMRQLFQSAEDSGADIIATVCPMCQFNLEAYQKNVNNLFGTSFNIPVLYFTQLMGLAYGIPAKELGIGSELVKAKAALEKILPEAPKPQKEEKRSKEALLMPMLEER